VGGFATSAGDDLLFVEDVQLVRQRCTSVSVVFDDGSVADYFDRQVEQGLRPDRFARIWWHTHPGRSAQPSSLDEETFERVFCRADWAVMFIVARDGDAYARLQLNTGPGGSLLIPVEVDFGRPFDGSDFAEWDYQYQENVVLQLPVVDFPGLVGDFVGRHEPITPRLETDGFLDIRPRAEEDLFWEELTREY
jgi:proteasome lid subunit RPN8/RPN11